MDKQKFDKSFLLTTVQVKFLNKKIDKAFFSNYSKVKLLDKQKIDKFFCQQQKNCYPKKVQRKKTATGCNSKFNIYVQTQIRK